MEHVAIAIFQDDRRRDTVLVGGNITWGMLRAFFNQAEVLIGPEITEPAESATLARLAQQKTIVKAGALRLEFGDGDAAMAAVSLQDLRPEPSSYGLRALADMPDLKDFRVQEMPDHQPRFTSRDTRRQAKIRPPKFR